jgi:ComF family protein
MMDIMACGTRNGLILLRGLFQDLLDFIYPPLCAVCGRAICQRAVCQRAVYQRCQGDGNNLVCPDCWRKLRTIPEPSCRRCGIPLAGTDSLCPACRSRRHLFSFACSYGLFDEVFQQIIHLFKYRRRRSLAGPLAERLAVTLRADVRFSRMDAVIPVPLHPAKRRARGFNQSELLARELSRRVGFTIIKGVLVRVINTPSQSLLGFDQRVINVRDAFRVRIPERVRERHIILLDDVITTGATADACADALLKAGAAEVSVLTVARALEAGTRI